MLQRAKKKKNVYESLQDSEMADKNVSGVVLINFFFVSNNEKENSLYCVQTSNPC